CLRQNLDLASLAMPTMLSWPMRNLHRSSITITEGLNRPWMFAELYSQSPPPGSSLLFSFSESQSPLSSCLTQRMLTSRRRSPSSSQLHPESLRVTKWTL
ncbi:troponin T, fast skeletal muscle isoforms-like, partial [Clarias magur]